MALSNNHKDRRRQENDHYTDRTLKHSPLPVPTHSHIPQLHIHLGGLNGNIGYLKEKMGLYTYNNRGTSKYIFFVFA